MRAQNWFAQHQTTLEKAVAAIQTRGYWSPYPEMPSGKIYGEQANENALAWLTDLKGQAFPLNLAGAIGQTGRETSPYGGTLAISYPKVNIDATLAAANTAMHSWQQASVDARAGVCLEILARLNQNSFKIAYSIMHTTGQAFMMAFQAGGPHAQDRGLEALAYAYSAMKRVPSNSTWEKPQGKNPALVMNKRYHIIPRGLSLIIGCCTFPTWNTYSAFFASLVTGNGIVFKPHNSAILPIALTVQIAREVLTEAGFDPNLVTMVAFNPDERGGQALAMRPEIKIIDFTGSKENGEWLEANARHAQVYTEKAGVNTIVIDSTNDLKGLARNLSFSLALYTGQMCTAPQNIYIPRDGILVNGEHVSFDTVAQAIAEASRKLLGDTDRAVEVLGAVQNQGIIKRIEQARALGNVVLDSQALTHPSFPEAQVHTPIMVKLDASQQEIYTHEWFGPVSFVIATDSTAHSLQLAQQTIQAHGAITLGVYSADATVLNQAEQTAIAAGVALSINLTGGVFVNQSAAFSDYHVSGANPAGNAALADDAFVCNRFRVVQARQHA